MAQAAELQEQLLAHCYGMIEDTDNATIINPIADSIDGGYSDERRSRNPAARSRWQRGGAAAVMVGMTRATRRALPGPRRMSNASNAEVQVESNHQRALSSSVATSQRQRGRLASVMRDHKHRMAEEVQLTADELASIEEAFDIFDTDGSGMFDVDELEVAIRALGIQVEPEEMQQIFAVIDEDGSGMVDKEEYKRAIAICKSANLGHGYPSGTNEHDVGRTSSHSATRGREYSAHRAGVSGPGGREQFDV